MPPLCSLCAWTHPCGAVLQLSKGHSAGPRNSPMPWVVLATWAMNCHRPCSQSLNKCLRTDSPQAPRRMSPGCKCSVASQGVPSSPLKSKCPAFSTVCPCNAHRFAPRRGVCSPRLQCEFGLSPGALPCWHWPHSLLTGTAAGHWQGCRATASHWAAGVPLRSKGCELVKDAPSWVRRTHFISVSAPRFAHFPQSQSCSPLGKPLAVEDACAGTAGGP